MYNRELQVTLEVLREASQMVRKIRNDRSEPQSLQKTDDSPVTVADFAVQALVCHVLKTEFPDDAIVAEEDAGYLRCPDMNAILVEVTGYLLPYLPDIDANAVCDWIDQGNGIPGGRFWVLDPVDGTRGFLRGAQYALALALIENGRVVLGALACPALEFAENRPAGQIYFAVRGGGAFVVSDRQQDQRPLVLPQYVDPCNLRLLESVETDHNDQPRQEAVARALGMTLSPLRVDSQVKYAFLAVGKGALYLRLPPREHASRHEKIWDHAAGVLIVEEAGGRVTDLYGSPLDFSAGVELEANRGIVAGAVMVHEQAIRALSIPGERQD